VSSQVNKPLAIETKSAASDKAKEGKGKLKFTLHLSDKEEDKDVNDRIKDAMEKAVAAYNLNTSLKGSVNVSHSPGTPTADGSSNGSIRFGGSIGQRVAMHEIAHTMGVGTSPKWAKLVEKGIFTGKRATQQLREITKDPKAVLHADKQHFWPYGLNYDTEVKSPEDFEHHCKMVEAICKDLE
jgi:hypothetical protein